MFFYVLLKVPFALQKSFKEPPRISWSLIKFDVESCTPLFFISKRAPNGFRLGEPKRTSPQESLKESGAEIDWQWTCPDWAIQHLQTFEDITYVLFESFHVHPAWTNEYLTLERLHVSCLDLVWNGCFSNGRSVHTVMIKNIPCRCSAEEVWFDGFWFSATGWHSIWDSLKREVLAAVDEMGFAGSYVPWQRKSLQLQLGAPKRPVGSMSHTRLDFFEMTMSGTSSTSMAKWQRDVSYCIINTWRIMTMAYSRNGTRGFLLPAHESATSSGNRICFYQFPRGRYGSSFQRGVFGRCHSH